MYIRIFFVRPYVCRYLIKSYIASLSLYYLNYYLILFIKLYHDNDISF